MGGRYEFSSCSTVQEAIIERTKHPAFGYFEPRDEYFDSIIKWQETRNDVRNLAKEHIGYENGVLGGVLSALKVFCSNGDNVLVHSPTYIGFTVSLKNNGYNIVHSDLVQDGRKFNGECHLRINLALPKDKIIEAFDRMDKYVFNK